MRENNGSNGSLDVESSAGSDYGRDELVTSSLIDGEPLPAYKPPRISRREAILLGLAATVGLLASDASTDPQVSENNAHKFGRMLFEGDVWDNYTESAKAYGVLAFGDPDVTDNLESEVTKLTRIKNLHDALDPIISLALSESGKNIGVVLARIREMISTRNGTLISGYRVPSYVYWAVARNVLLPPNSTIPTRFSITPSQQHYVRVAERIFNFATKGALQLDGINDLLETGVQVFAGNTMTADEARSTVYSFLGIWIPRDEYNPASGNLFSDPKINSMDISELPAYILENYNRLSPQNRMLVNLRVYDILVGSAIEQIMTGL